MIASFPLLHRGKAIQAIGDSKPGLPAHEFAAAFACLLLPLVCPGDLWERSVHEAVMPASEVPAEQP